MLSPDVFGQTNQPPNLALMDSSATTNRSSRVNPALRQLIESNFSGVPELPVSTPAKIPTPGTDPADSIDQPGLAERPRSNPGNRLRRITERLRPPTLDTSGSPAIQIPIRQELGLAEAGVTLAPTNSTVTSDSWSFRESRMALEEARMDEISQRIDEGGFGPVRGGRGGNFVDRGLERIFAPEPIRIGNARIGFSPYTAITRRNPLCLLNPIPLVFSW